MIYIECLSTKRNVVYYRYFDINKIRNCMAHGSSGTSVRCVTGGLI